MGCPDADMDLTCRGRMEETVAPGDGTGDAAGTSGRLKDIQKMKRLSTIRKQKFPECISPVVLHTWYNS